MSMELYLFSDVHPASMSEWQRAIDAHHNSLRLSSDQSLDVVRGALPVRFKGKSTCFEYDVIDDVHGLRTEFSDIDLKRAWRFAVVLRWGADLDAAAAAYAAAAGYAHATGGVILDGEEGRLISAQRALEISAEIESSRAQVEAAVSTVVSMLKGN